MGLITNNLVQAIDGVAGNNFPAAQFNPTIRELNNSLVECQPAYSDPSGLETSGANNETKARLDNLILSRKSAFLCTGSANSIVLTTDASYQLTPIKEYYKYQEISFIAFATNTGAVQANTDGLGNKDVKQESGSALSANMITAGGRYNFIYNGTYWILKNPTISTIANKAAFSVNQAKLNASGSADFLQKDSNTQITILAGASNPNLVLSYYDADFSAITSNIVASGLSTDGSFVLIYDYTTNSVLSILSSTISEGIISPTGGSNGDYYIQMNPLITYQKIAGVWTESKFVKLGEYTRTAGIIGTPISYALNGAYSVIQTTLNSSSNYVFNANIGSKNINVLVGLECISADIGYNVGDRVFFANGQNSTIAAFAGCAISATNNTITLIVGNNSFMSVEKSGSPGGPTEARWNAIVNVKRNF
jgi:hypothetical protein